MRQLKDWGRFMNTVRALSPLAFAAALAVAVLLGLLPAAEFWAVQGLVNALLSGAAVSGAWQGALLSLAGLVATMAAGEALRGTQPLLHERLKQDAEFTIDHCLVSRASAADLMTLESPAFFDRLSRSREGLKRHTNEVIVDTLGILRNVVALGSVLAVLASAHWAAVAVILAGVVPGWYMRRWMSANLTRLWREQTEESRKAQYVAGLLTDRRAAQEIRLYDLGGELLRRWERHTLAPLASRLAIIRRAGLLDGTAGVLGALSYSGAVAILAGATLAGRLTAGGFAAAVRVTQDFQGSMYELIWSFSRLQRTTAFTQDLWAFLDGNAGDAGRTRGITPPAAARAESRPAATACEVAFEQVTFSYPGAGRPALDDVCFRIAPGEMIAIVGENGAGKTTLAKLLLGLYRSSAGRIAIDGDDPAGAGNHLRARMAPVFQNYLRYAVTAGENIGLGFAPGLSDRARISAAAAASGADAVIDGLPRGYETQLGREWHDGTDLSGGQWQKLAIARAYMRDASLLVLDEPTAALDPLAELEVFRQFKRLVRGRTSVLISHRLGAARLADRILVMKDGRLVEAGTHDELMASEGEYAALFRAQAEWYK